MSIAQTIRTIRYLKPAQVVGQARLRLRPLYERPEQLLKLPVPPPEPCRWRKDVSFLAPGVQENSAEALAAGRFVFLNEERNPGWPPENWDAPGAGKLWQYNLNYFEWLWALDYEAARTAVLDWIARCPPARRVGWEPYPLSLRLMNWCGTCFGKFREKTDADDEFRRELWRSLYVQAEWLSGHLETHLLGNHLLENGAALAFAGSCFLGECGEKWLRKGIEILERQIPEQILPDGMHFERSPMYHVRMTYLMRLLHDTGNEQLKRIVAEPLARMQRALAFLCHPDGEIALFNDSAFGIYNAPADLLGPDQVMPAGPWALPDAGYCGYRGGEGSYIICDAGSIGPDYQPGHAHGDIFSFELSLKGRRVIVDSGVCTYEQGEMRRYCRSTEAHNTLEIEGKDQSEFSGAFRVGARGRPGEVKWEPAPQGFTLSGRHDGYMRLRKKATHHRRFVYDSAECLEIHDSIAARNVVAFALRLHLHPDCRIIELQEKSGVVEIAGGFLAVTFAGTGALSVAESFYCPEFGKQLPNTCLCYSGFGKDTISHTIIRHVSSLSEVKI